MLENKFNKTFGYVYLTPIYPTRALMETQPAWRLHDSVGEIPNAYAVRDEAVIIACRRHLPHSVHSRLREVMRHLFAGTQNLNLYLINPVIVDSLREFKSDEDLQAIAEILAAAARPDKVRA